MFNLTQRDWILLLLGVLVGGLLLNGVDVYCWTYGDLQRKLEYASCDWEINQLESSLEDRLDNISEDIEGLPSEDSDFPDYECEGYGGSSVNLDCTVDSYY